MALFEQATEASSGGTGGKAPLLDAGGYPARLMAIVDCGLQPGSAQYPEPRNEMVMFFECLDEFMTDEEGNELLDQPRIFDFSLSYNTDGYVGKTSKLHGIMVALDGFQMPLRALLGRACNIALIQKTSKTDASKKFNVMTGLSAMRPKDAEKAEPAKLPTQFFSLDASATKEEFDKIPLAFLPFGAVAKIKTSLSLHKEAPQLAAALNIEERKAPEGEKKADEQPAEQQFDETIPDELPATVGGAVPTGDAEEDPFA